ncbi:hypothetical protein V1460_35315 [Streptomyces sp. SCSIO 30461]|uniref:right-handed parallel beta-helix repeat-containing protein n=1 Tax=Streptomyces sp. SCSIO 30461 TaxID=3118085 RepID=UPI0030CD01C6
MSQSHVAAMLSRHWKLAVLAAAGCATVTAATTIAAVAHSGQPDAGSVATAADGKGMPAGDGGGKGEGVEGKRDHDRGGKGGHAKGDGEYGGHHGGADATHVECDPNDLIANLVDLNAERGGELVLAKDCLYTLTANQDDNGLPEITQPIAIHGNGATIQRAANGDDFRVFEVGVGGDLKLSHLTITRGKLGDGGEGGGIRVAAAGRLDLDHVTLDRNSTDLENSDGGAVYNEGVTTIRDSTLNKNTSEDGAAVYNQAGKLEISDSKITGNINDPDLGYPALYNENGTTKVKKSLLSYNYGYYGGGLYNREGVAEVEKSAFTYNFGYYGGGIYVDDPVYVRDSTVAHNTVAADGGGLILNDAAVIENTRIYGNVAIDSEGGGAHVANAGNTVVFRNSEIHDNQAPGNGLSGGGISISSGGRVNLTDTKVTGNISDREAGGVQNNGTVTTNGKVRIIDNVPTNCQATGTNPVPDCFG